MTWRPIESMPRGTIAWTKVEDADGESSKRELKRFGGARDNKLFFTPDGSTYVYYTPTHWWRADELEATE